MSYRRMGHLALRLLRRTMLCLALLLMSCSLIAMGGLIWVGNSWAVITDDNPGTSFDGSIVFEAMAGELDCEDLDPDGDGQIPVAGGKLMRGNGDQDDNRPEPLRIVYRLGALIEPSPFSASLVFRAHRVVSSYLDFGHLKVFPDAVLPLIPENICNSLKAATHYTCGGLLLLLGQVGTC